MGHVDIINSTLGKALGGAAGGYTTGPKELIDLLRQRSRPYLFSNSLPPPVVAGASKVRCRLFQDTMSVYRVCVCVGMGVFGGCGVYGLEGLL